MRPESLKLEQERGGNTLELTGIDNDFLNRIPMAQQLRERMDKWDCMKLKSFCTTKEMVYIEVVARRMGENLCQLYI
jgi:hypothetical protein